MGTSSSRTSDTDAPVDRATSAATSSIANRKIELSFFSFFAPFFHIDLFCTPVPPLAPELLHVGQVLNDPGNHVHLAVQLLDGLDGVVRLPDGTRLAHLAVHPSGGLDGAVRLPDGTRLVLEPLARTPGGRGAPMGMMTVVGITGIPRRRAARDRGAPGAVLRRWKNRHENKDDN